jgi:uncharacterized protein YdiU (UPF0061 family)
MFSRVGTADFPETVIRYQNTAWARHLGIADALDDDALWIDRFARFTPLPGSLKAPLALAYHGHQFGVYNPEIGDGRGILYAQIEDPADGRLLDLGTKGSGLTPYSRTADGRLTLKGAVREILATEMLDALGVYTSKTFSVIETGEALVRGDEPSPTRSAVLVRLSHSHIRIGSFQRLAYLQDRDMLERLLRYVAATYYEGSLDAGGKTEDLAPAFVRAMGQKMAVLAASWMAAGFVHGVLNTDNFNITGESFDYGPWRFLPQMTPGFTAAYFDHQGRYAYGRQPEATLWALCRLADCLVDLSSLEAMQSAVTSFQDSIHDAMTQALCRRLGIDAGWEGRGRMTEALIKAIRDTETGFEEVLFDWYGGGASASRALSGKRKKFYKSSGFAEPRELLSNAPAAKGIRLDHSYFGGDDPQTMLIDEVETIWDVIAADDDWSRLSDKIDAIHAMSEAYGDRSLPPEVRIPL